MTYEIKKQQTIDQQILESDIEDLTKFSLNQEYNFAKNDLSNKTDEHESDNRLQNSSDHDSDDSSADGNRHLSEESHLSPLDFRTGLDSLPIIRLLCNLVFVIHTSM